MPPLSQIKHLVQAKSVIEELAFVNQQSRIAPFLSHGFDDLVERHNLVLELWRMNTQGQKGARQSSRNSYLYFRYFRWFHFLIRDHHGPIVIADGSAVGQQGIFVRNVRVGVKTYCGNVVSAFSGLFVECLNVLYSMFAFLISII